MLCAVLLPLSMRRADRMARIFLFTGTVHEIVAGKWRRQPRNVSSSRTPPAMPFTTLNGTKTMCHGVLSVRGERTNKDRKVSTAGSPGAKNYAHFCQISEV